MPRSILNYYLLCKTTTSTNTTLHYQRAYSSGDYSTRHIHWQTHSHPLLTRAMLSSSKFQLNGPVFEINNFLFILLILNYPKLIKICFVQISMFNHLILERPSPRDRVRIWKNNMHFKDNYQFDPVSFSIIFQTEWLYSEESKR